ncbi:MAG: cbb3-type cytochrome c oxidase subunit I [Bacteroidetes bacterium]|nr:cbb3-type cytochrome c oxidase subunit I [Bacteroidota bacterium]
MRPLHRLLVGFSLALLTLTLLVGTISAFAFLFPEASNRSIPFYMLRPMHVSAALFWIITGAVSGILIYLPKVYPFAQPSPRVERSFVLLWLSTIGVIFTAYAFKKFGGREYWAFPPWLGIPLLVAWVCLLVVYFRAWRSRSDSPLYVWMWTTGVVAFLATFLEQNLYHIPWFRMSFLRELTVQWKSNGAMVGAWNQMIYGTALFLMVRISGDEKLAKSRSAFFFYFLGLTNLMFNWGHHIYNLPTNHWIRHIAYAITMTEWILLVNIIRGFRAKLASDRKYHYQLPYRFLAASEYWVLANLVLALFMSIPAINRYTHGTHITVAHAMGATIGINTMILLASFGYALKIDRLGSALRKNIAKYFVLVQVFLVIFWLALISAGVLKAWRETVLGMNSFDEIMRPVRVVLYLFAIAGVGLFFSMLPIIRAYWLALKQLGQGAKNVSHNTIQQPMEEQPN